MTNQNISSAAYSLQRKEREGEPRAMQYLIQLSQFQECNAAIEDAADIGCHWYWYYASTDTSYHVPPLNNSMNHPNARVPPTVLLVSQDTDVSTGTNTGTKGQIIHLSNHLNILNAMVSLMHHQQQVTRDMLLPFMCKKLKCLSNASYMPHMPISSHAHRKHLCQHICII